MKTLAELFNPGETKPTTAGPHLCLIKRWNSMMRWEDQTIWYGWDTVSFLDGQWQIREGYDYGSAAEVVKWIELPPAKEMI